MKIYAPTARAARRVECPQSNGAPDSAPADFDATANPIIAVHIFGIESLRPIGQITAEVVADQKFRRQIERLHRLGPRVTAEFLAELGAERSIQTVIDRKLDTYAELEPEALEVTGGDGFWPVPLHEVRRGP